MKLISLKIMKKNTQHRDVHDEPPDIRCFCKKHADEYRKSGDYVLKRPDKDQIVMDKCDKCDKLGFDYILVKRVREKKDTNRLSNIANTNRRFIRNEH